MSTKLLAIETSTEACSAALWIDGTITEEFVRIPNRHSELLLPMIDKVLAQGQTTLKQVDVIALGRGPGAFTGLRIGAGIAQGLAFGREIPVVTISSLQALAQGYRANQVLAAIDARMDQIYWACYHQFEGSTLPIGDERLTFPQQLSVPQGGVWLGVGSGWDRYHVAMRTALPSVSLELIPDACPRAAHVAQLGALEYGYGRALPAAQAQPYYLRNQVV